MSKFARMKAVAKRLGVKFRVRAGQLQVQSAEALEQILAATRDKPLVSDETHDRTVVGGREFYFLRQHPRRDPRVKVLHFRAGERSPSEEPREVTGRW